MNRIPVCKNVEDWAREMFRLGLAFNLDDDPSEIVNVIEGGLGPPLFSKEEVDDLRAIIHNLTDEEAETYHRTVVDEVRKSNGLAPVRPHPDRL